MNPKFSVVMFFEMDGQMSEHMKHRQYPSMPMAGEDKIRD